MSALEWRSYGTGSEAWAGPVRCAVYKRGEWVVDLTWRGRPGSYRDGGSHDSPDAAQRAAEATAATWLREEIASLTSALATLEAPAAPLRTPPQTPPT